MLKSSSACCERKPSLGCCGNGPCNIFCCNCDGGCNVGCENANCNTAEWASCAAVIGGCGVVCVTDPSTAGCVSCMGGLYGTCVNCFDRRRLRGGIDESSNLSYPISAENFDELVDERIHVELSKNPDFDSETFLRENSFSMFDKDGDGYISIDEADCSDTPRLFDDIVFKDMSFSWMEE